MKSVRIHPTPTLQGKIQVPGDKSISHRAVMMAALARGKSLLKGLLLGDDVMATIRCFQAMGVSIQVGSEQVEVQGVGLRGLQAPTGVLDCGNSGTTMRLMLGILAGQSFTSRLTGDASLNRRPMDRVVTPLRQMGAQIEELRGSPGERVLKLSGRPLKGIEYRLPVASAQVKSAILLAGLYAQGETKVIETIPSRDHTERIFVKKGIPLKRQGDQIILEKGDSVFPGEVLSIPGDISSAAFFLVAGSIARSAEIQMEAVGTNPTRTGILEVLNSMGAQIERGPEKIAGGEPLADLAVRPAPLYATRISGERIPRLIDEIPILGVAAARAKGRTEILEAGELRVKESDRIASLAGQLKKMACNIKELPDGLFIEGPAIFQGGALQSHGDHRIAMSLAIAATQASSPATIEDVDCVDTSYPDFWAHLAELGGRVEFL